MSSQTFTAKYNTACAACPERIYPDQEAVFNADDQITHAVCDAIQIFVSAPTSEICPICFMALPVSGRCDCND